MTKTIEIPPALDDKYIIQPAALENMDAYAELYDIHMREENGTNNVTIEELRGFWEAPKFDLENSTQAIFTHNGKMVGYIEVRDTMDIPVRPRMWGYVHPDHRGHGIGAYLTSWAQERARQVFGRVPDNARVVLTAHTISTDVAAQKVFCNMGMSSERSVLVMHIDLNDEIAEAQWPDGIRIVSYAETQDLSAIVKVQRETFKDHRNYVEVPLETSVANWQHEIDTIPSFEPELFFLAMDGEQAAGVVMAWPDSDEDEEMAWIDVVGVTRAYRKKGLGLALLQYSFMEFRKRGIARAGLSVDGRSLTGATRLYERAGMHVNMRYDSYEKELRPGEELSKQSLDI
jgi:mycothiol synthase